MTVGSGRLRRSDRLLRSRDFSRVARSGKRFASRDFVVLIAPRAQRDQSPVHLLRSYVPSQRLGVTASRKVGNAVVRNRIKRGVREWFRTRRNSLAADIDIVVIARPKARSLGAGEIDESLCELVKRIAQAPVAAREETMEKRDT